MRKGQNNQQSNDQETDNYPILQSQLSSFPLTQQHIREPILRKLEGSIMPFRCPYTQFEDRKAPSYISFFYKYPFSYKEK